MKRVDELTQALFASLKDGAHQFSIRGPEGGTQFISLYVHGGRRKIRSIQFIYGNLIGTLGIQKGSPDLRRPAVIIGRSIIAKYQGVRL